MPKNYQISQYDEPLCTDGWLDVEVGGKTVRVGIERVHLEEDTGKSLHVGGSTGRIHGAEYSLVDYNRAGIPLVEVVTKPIPGTGALAPAVARAYVAELRDLMRALGVSDVRMEQGSLRCDVNTSIAPHGSAQWGTRTETKNVNSLRSVERAVRTEIERQAGVLDAGGRIMQETRHFHEEHRHDDIGPQQGRGAGLPVPPRARPRAGRARRPSGSRRSGRTCPSCPRRAGQRCRRSSALTSASTWTRSSTPERSTWSPRPSRLAPRRSRPATGGWASCPGEPTRRARNSARCRSPRPRSRGSARWSTQAS